MATPLEQLDAMRDLRQNWDGYDGDPPLPAVLDLAKEFVALLAALRQADPYRDMFVTPGRDGSVLIEWQDAQFEHELEVNADGSIGFLHTEKATGVMTDRDFRPGQFTVHPGLLRELQQSAAA